MATTVNLRKLLHRKAWESCTNAPANTTAGAFIVSDKFNVMAGSRAVLMTSSASVFMYEGDQDAWQQLPASGATGTFGLGSCGEMRGLGAMGGVFTQTATAGTTTSITTNKTIVKSLVGCRVCVVAGTGMGYDSFITSNTLGANAILTLPAHTVAFDATTQYQVYSGSVWFFNAGVGVVGFSVYDFATNSWAARSVTGLPTSFTTSGQLISTLGAAGGFANGTATGATSTTLSNSAKSWAVNMFANFQVRITTGTGKGQMRLITSNTSTELSTSAWAVVPDATSQYVIEGNTDCFYLFGNAAVTMYKFTVSTNTWATVVPVSARGGVTGGGGTADWVDGVVGWDTETAVPHYSTVLFKQNGRYIYCLRGGLSTALDVYDIAGNTWISVMSYGGQSETFNTGSHSIDMDGKIYITKDGTGRIFIFDIASNDLVPFATNTSQSANFGIIVEGDKSFMLPYSDGGTTIFYYYALRHSSADLVRMMVI